VDDTMAALFLFSYDLVCLHHYVVTAMRTSFTLEIFALMPKFGGKSTNNFLKNLKIHPP